MRIGAAKETYAADAALFDTPTQKRWAVLLAAALVVFPFAVDEYWLYLACLVAINVASAAGLNLLTGYTGLVSLGQAAFMGVGAYTVAILQARWQLHFLPNLLAGGVVAMCCGIVVGLPSLRVKGLYLAIATIAAGVLAHFIFAHWTAVTGGSAGLTVRPAQAFGVDLDTSFRFYWLALPVTALLLLGIANLMRTRIGRAWLAVRDHDIAARAMGIDLMRTKLLAFMVSAFYTGVAGALVAAQTRFINVDTFSVLVSIEALAMVIVGGMGRVHGAILGTALIVLLPETLNLAFGAAGDGVKTLMADRIYEVKGLMYGVVILLFLRLEPEGLAGIWRKVKRFWVQWPLSQ